MDIVGQIAVLLLSLGGLFALLNWLALFQTWRTGRFCSGIPLIGTACLGAGALLLPSTRPYAWAVLLLDFSALLFLVAIPHIAKEAYETSRFNLLEEYVGERGNKTVCLRLFRKNIFTLRQDFRRTSDEDGVVQLSTIGRWDREEQRLKLRFGEDCALFEAQSEGGSEIWRQVSGFWAYEREPERSLQAIDMRLTQRRAS
jgi:hypothetical protein